jgi:mRNA-degrading endonuclease YafQ of YafQ-DinJ toxin-antitoxin module
MGADLFDPRLKTHALSGTLAGFHACSCGHDCRIVFALRATAGSAPDRIVLVNVGTHEVVY